MPTMSTDTDQTARRERTRRGRLIDREPGPIVEPSSLGAVLPAQSVEPPAIYVVARWSFSSRRLDVTVAIAT
jgi:hypothetical protein